MNIVSSKTIQTNAGCAPGSNRNLPSNGVIYVQNVPAAGSDPNHSSCSGSSCYGDVNISGTLNGQLTVAAENDINITGDVKYHQYPSAATTCSVSSRTTMSRSCTRTARTSPTT